MNKDKPEVSVGLATYNRERYLSEAIESILNQDFENFELIISDNGSDDRTYEICKYYEDKDHRIRYYRFPVNLGSDKNFVRAFQAARGDYFMWASDDDLHEKAFISKCLSILRQDSSVAICYPRAKYIDEAGESWPEQPDDFVKADHTTPKERFSSLLWNLDVCNVFYGLIRSDALHQIKRWPSHKAVGWDIVILQALSLQGKFIQIQDTLFIRRFYHRRRQKPFSDQFYSVIGNHPSARNEGITLPVCEFALELLDIIKYSSLNEEDKAELIQEILKCFRNRWGKFIQYEIKRAIQLVNEGEFRQGWQTSCSVKGNITEQFYISTAITRLERAAFILPEFYEQIHQAQTICLQKLGRKLHNCNSCPEELKNTEHVRQKGYLNWEYIRSKPSIKLYAGDIVDVGKKYDGLIGLSLTQHDHRHIKHDVVNPLPLSDNSVDSYQAEDVFEHIEYDKLLPVINEVYRVLKPGALFRLSVPDYGCDILANRSVKDASGNIVFDPDGGGTPQNPGHVWFPRIDKVRQLLEKSSFGKFGKIEYLHYYNMDGTFVTNKIDYSKGYVRRTPDFDERIQHPYRPMSMVIDLIKSGDIPQKLSQSDSLKFLQIQTFYPQYLKSYYEAIPQLASASFEEQIEALIKDGFSGIHIFAPYMSQYGYEAQLIVANNPYSQQQWIRENNEIISNTKDWMYEIVRKQVDRIKPDVLYLTDSLTFDSRFVRTLSWKPRLTMGWRAASIRNTTDWSDFDIMLSHLSRCRQKAIELGAKSVEHYFPGFPEFLAEAVKNDPKVWDVVFSGQATSEHRKRNEYLRELSKAALENNRQFSTAFFIPSPHPDLLSSEIIRNNHGARWGKGMYQALKSGRIVLNAEIDLAGGEAGNMRLFETTGVGSFLLTEYHDNIREYFEPGVEIETFRDSKELIEKIHYYLSHPDEREAIARRGQERCLRDYSMENRARAFDQIIRKHLALKSNPPHTPNVTAIIQQAVDNLNTNKNAEALALLEQAMAVNPAIPGINYGKTVALARIGRMDEAIDALKALLSVKPNHKKAQVLLNEITVAFISNLMSQAANALNANKNDDAFALLNKAKSLRKPTQGLDYLRAIYFLRINQPIAAKESLQEELRYFSNNQDAKNLLDQIIARYPQLVSPKIGDSEFQELFKIIRPYTMLSEERLFSLFSLSKRVCLEDIPGNFVECGVAAGGSSALLSAVIKRYSKRPRRHYAFDSFEGMPTPTGEDKQYDGKAAESTGWGTGTCAASEQSVMEICTKLGVSDIVKPVKGYFEQTLPEMKNELGKIAFLHMDGDWYESTKTVLQNLYDHISANGIIQVDDYGHWAGCKKALHEFESLRKIKFEINQIDFSGIWFSKPTNMSASTGL